MLRDELGSKMRLGKFHVLSRKLFASLQGVPHLSSLTNCTSYMARRTLPTAADVLGSSSLDRAAVGGWTVKGDGRYSGTSSATPQNAFKGLWHRSYFCLGRLGSHHPDRQSYEGARCSNERSVGPCGSLVPEDLGPQEASEGQRLDEQGTDYSDWAACVCVFFGVFGGWSNFTYVFFAFVV